MVVVQTDCAQRLEVVGSLVQTVPQHVHELSFVHRTYLQVCYTIQQTAQPLQIADTSCRIFVVKVTNTDGTYCTLLASYEAVRCSQTLDSN